MSQPLQELIQKVAAHPHGLGFLHQATLESVAITLRVSPSVAAEARALLETPEGRALLIEGVRAARESAPAGPAAPLGADESRPARSFDDFDEDRREDGPARPSSPGELIELALNHPLGESFLRDGALESVAITFGAHPLLVLQAREILTRADHANNRDMPRPIEE